MSILTIVQAVCKNVGLDVPDTAVSNTDREYVELLQFTREAADEIGRRADWGALRKTATITGTGSNDNFALPADFGRLTSGNAVKSSTGNVRGGISQDEWFSLTPIQGVPRYFRSNGASISFYPYPANAAAITVSYQSSAWASNGSADWSSDSDMPLVPSDLVMKGTLWRWKRKIGQDFSDYLAEFEAAFADLSNFDSRDRTP
jgi:hypothetical protein